MLGSTRQYEICETLIGVHQGVINWAQTGAEVSLWISIKKRSIESAPYGIGETLTAEVGDGGSVRGRNGFKLE